MIITDKLVESAARAIDPKAWKVWDTRKHNYVLAVEYKSSIDISLRSARAALSAVAPEMHGISVTWEPHIDEESKAFVGSLEFAGIYQIGKEWRAYFGLPEPKTLYGFSSEADVKAAVEAVIIRALSPTDEASNG